jgi:vesicle coat complex subunit
MKRIHQMAVVGLAVLTPGMIGCGKAKPPLLAGGKSVDHWVAALADSEVKVREEAVTKLGNVGTSDPAAIPALITALKDKNAEVRREAIFALTKSGNVAHDAVEPLTELQQHDQDPKVRELAAKGLKRLQTGANAGSS